MSNWFNSYSRPHFGVLVAWVVIYIAVTKTPVQLSDVGGERIGPASVISFLPDSILSSHIAFHIARGVLLASGVLWACHLMLPISSWLTVLSFTYVVAMSFENSSHASHTYHVANIVMLIHVLWYQFYRKEIAEGLRLGNFWQSRIYPQWVFSASVLYIGLYHSFAGISKLVWSGPGWADGTSLQLWMHLFGNENSYFAQLLLSNRQLAAGLQVGTLVIETAAVLAICSRKLRTAIGLALLGFYAGIILTFGFRFRFNALLVGLFFLPCDVVIDLAYGYFHKMFSVDVRAQGVPAIVARVLRAVLHRLDAFQCVHLQLMGGPAGPLRVVSGSEDVESPGEQLPSPAREQQLRKVA